MEDLKRQHQLALYQCNEHAVLLRKQAAAAETARLQEQIAREAAIAEREAAVAETALAKKRALSAEIEAEANRQQAQQAQLNEQAALTRAQELETTRAHAEVQTSTWRLLLITSCLSRYLG